MSLFVVFEGLDGAGTTTQTQLMVEALRNSERPAIQTREPSDGPIGVLIRQMLSMRVVSRLPQGFEPVNRESLALLFAADRLDHVQNTVVPALHEGKVVISDRYYASSFVYQGDVDESEHFDVAWVRELNSRARRPDLTIFLEAPVDVCLERMGSRAQRDIYETQEKLTRLHGRYAQVMSLLEEAGEPILRLDATQDIGTIHARCLQEILSRSAD